MHEWDGFEILPAGTLIENSLYLGKLLLCRSLHECRLPLVGRRATSVTSVERHELITGIRCYSAQSSRRESSGDTFTITVDPNVRLMLR